MNESGEKERTQRRILGLLKSEGSLDSGKLAAILDVTPMAIRLHLYELADRGDVEFTEERRGRGRPAKIWKLTPRAERHFPDRHGELAASFLETARRTLGETTLKSIIDARGAEQAESYRAALSHCATLEEKVRRLAELRTTEGYMAESGRDEDGSLRLIENHCPICSAARTCREFCGAEIDAFRSALGPGVSVERTEHILSGHRRCVYVIR